jgi:hypothetical protein
VVEGVSPNQPVNGIAMKSHHFRGDPTVSLRRGEGLDTDLASRLVYGLVESPDPSVGFGHVGKKKVAGEILDENVFPPIATARWITFSSCRTLPGQGCF